MSTPHSLNQIQRWMQTVITHPDGIQAGIVSPEAAKLVDIGIEGVERVILPSSQLSSLDRLQIYGRAYFSRLIECLRAQFPAVRHAVGDEAFDGLAFGYLVQNPSTDYTLGSLGDSFEAFLRATRPPRSDSLEVDQPDFADFLIDLARLELTYSEVFHCEGPERSRCLELSDFENLSAEGFANCRLVPFACVRLLELRFPVHEYASSIRIGAKPSISIARPVYLVVTRRDYVVRRFEITRPQFELLSALTRQATIGESIESLSTRTDVDFASLVVDLRLWFRDWSAAPLFSELAH